LLVINKVDKDNCTPDEVHEKVFDLMFELDANDEQLEFETIYGSAKNGWMSTDWKAPTTNITPLLDKILEYFPPRKIEEGNTQMLITSLDFSSYVGRIAIGCLKRGTIAENQNVIISKSDGELQKHKIKEIFVFEGLERKRVTSVQAGDICAITGIEGFEIGDCICDFENPEPLERIAIDEPTMSMMFSINDSPFFGKEGKFVTSRHIQERLQKELEKNLALRVKDTDKADKWMVFGRGVLHLSVLIETMRREGYELQVGQPQVIIREIDGAKCEPIEELTIDLPEEFSGTAVEAVTKRKGEMKNMVPKGERMTITFEIPSRGIIGLRNYMLTQTAGEAIMNHRFLNYQPYKGEIPGRQNGSLISMEQGTSIPFSLNNLQERGKFFIHPNESVYEGQVIGENSRNGDMIVNVTKTKKMSNMRSSGADDKVRLAPPKVFSLEECLEYIQSDEYVEVTPQNLRIRKILLKETDRKRSGK
ncbi:MAG: translational GTPase TypA, partial [Crocinitomicaceae bacterium]|nr:translational GTPase TypA [Crocinitomicaceae bacterium]